LSMVVEDDGKDQAAHTEIVALKLNKVLS
jgi:hypothetical protein